MNTKQILFRIAAAVSVVGLSCIPTEQVGVWVLNEATALGTNNTGSLPAVLVVGDGLVSGIAEKKGDDGPAEFANHIRFWSGRSAFVGGTKDASLAHYESKTLMLGPDSKKSLLETGLEAVTPEITVLAVGSDDARILSTDGARGTERYTIGDYRGALSRAIALSLYYSPCVVLVNVANHWASTVSGPDLAAINARIADAAAADPSRVRLADWATHSAGQTTWFNDPAEIDHTQTGRVAYRNFIITNVITALDNGCSLSPAVANGQPEQVTAAPSLLPSRGAEETEARRQGAERATDLLQAR
jgi:hypothetical protein